MNEIPIGTYIRQHRKEQKLTQEQLCQGICEPITISRLENGTQTPSPRTLSALLQRLGLSENRCYILTNSKEQQIDHPHKEIVSLNIQYQNSLDTQKKNILALAYQKLYELEQIIDNNDTLSRQLILRSKILLGKEDGSVYEYEEQLELLMQAIHLTVPGFELDEIGKHLYSLDEIKVINQIAGVYSAMGRDRKAIDILDQLIKYIQVHYQHITQSAGHLPMVAHNYARVLYRCKRYEESLEICNIGKETILEFGHYQYLPGIVHLMALCHYQIGNLEYSRNLFAQSYYIFEITGNKKGAILLQKDALKYLNILLPY